MNPRKASIGALLGEYERRHVVLPEFQRPYSWEKTQLAAFWGDLKNFCERYKKDSVAASYFLGPIVTIESSAEITVLDGQPRLATATILLSVLRDIAREIHGAQPLQELDYFARDIQRELIEKKDTQPLRYALTLSELDEPYFLPAFKTSPATPATPAIRSHKLMQAAYDYFHQEVSVLTDGKQALPACEELKLLRDTLTKGMNLVVIVVDDEESAYDIFEALNDRGLRLSVPDLVVNLF